MVKKKELTDAEKIDKCIVEMEKCFKLIRKNIDYMNRIGKKLKKADKKLTRIEAKAKL